MNEKVDIDELLKQARALLAAATPGPWGSGEHVGEPRAICSTPQGLESLLGLDRDGMAICASAADAALIVFAVGNLAALCDALRIEKQRADEAEAGAAAMRACVARLHELASNGIQSSGPLADMHPAVLASLAGQCERAIATDAGAPILARLRAAESERDRLRADLALYQSEATDLRDKVESGDIEAPWRAEVERLRAEVERLRTIGADLLAVAKGCTDYGGGHRGACYDAFQDGVLTVARVLEKRLAGDNDYQMQVLEAVGSSVVVPEVGK